MPAKSTRAIERTNQDHAAGVRARALELQAERLAANPPAATPVSDTELILRLSAYAFLGKDYAGADLGEIREGLGSLLTRESSKGDDNPGT